jgi:plasmid stabilization system protein ParE
MDVTIIWSREALEQIDNVVNYLLDEWSEKEVQQFLSELNRTVFILSKNPFLFPASEKYKNLRKAIITEHNSIVYRYNTKSSKVEVITILHSRMNNKKLR